MLHRTIIATTVALMLTGCAGSASTAPPRTEAPKPPTMSQAEDACGARQVQDHVAKPIQRPWGNAWNRKAERVM